MATNLKVDLALGLKAKLVSSLDLSSPQDPLTKSISLTLTNGTSSDQADLIFHDQRTLTTAASEELDLAGALVDAFGNTLTFATVKALIIQNTSTSYSLTIGGAASNAFVNWVADATDKVVIGPGGFFALTCPKAGYAVTADTGDKLKITNGAGGSTVYNIIIIGTSE